MLQRHTAETSSSPSDSEWSYKGALCLYLSFALTHITTSLGLRVNRVYSKRTPVKMKLFSIILLGYVSLPLSSALIGYGITMYNPSCAFACRAAIASAPLSCSEEGGHSGHMGHGGGAMTTPECRASDTPFLTTLAWCMQSTCAQFNVEAWRLERYWRDKATGDPAEVPKWAYEQALEQVTQQPQQEVSTTETLNFTATVPYESWDAQRRTLEHFEKQETLHSRYGYGAKGPKHRIY